MNTFHFFRAIVSHLFDFYVKNSVQPAGHYRKMNPEEVHFALAAHYSAYYMALLKTAIIWHKVLI